MKKISKFIRGLRLWYVISGVVVIAILGVVIWKKSNPAEAEVVRVEKGSVTQEVVVSGQLKSAKSVSLSFEETGRVQRIGAEVGDKVHPGDTLLELNRAEILAQIREAEASVAVQEAKLKELQSGSRPEDVRIKQAELQKAEQDLSNYYQGLPDDLADAYANADDAARKQLDDIFQNDDQTNVQLSFSTTDFQNEINAKNQRLTITEELKAWRTELALLPAIPDSKTMDTALENGRTRLLLMRKLLDVCMQAVTNGINISAANSSTYKTNITTARNNVNASITELNTASQNIASQKIVVIRYQTDLEKSIAGSTPESIDAQKALVRQAEAQLQTIRAKASKGILSSPIAGTVTKVDIEQGEIVSPNTPVVWIISDSQLEIEVNVPEVDIGKVSLGNPVRITMDAFPGRDFEGHVAYIEPAETIVDGVTNFKVKVTFDTADPNLKPGLTASLRIETVRKNDVLILPQYAIIEKNGEFYVRKIQLGGKSAEAQVTVGTRGQGGTYEILDGVLEGEQVEVVGVRQAGK